jgi:membrane-bound lytic murein transglycosylase D
VHYRRSLILPLVLALAACATPAPPPPVEPPVVAALPAIVFPLPPQKIVMIDPFKGAAADLEPLPPSTGDLWDRIVQGYAIPDMEGPLVEKWEQWYSDRPDYVARVVERSRRYLYHIVSEVEARGMPLEIALLPIVESAFNPNAISVSRASGFGQLMPSTGTT